MSRFSYIYLIVLVIVIQANWAKSQIIPPYSDGFESGSSWTHYAISNTDDWELGTPSDSYLSSAYSGTKAWATDTANIYSAASSMALETPSFDLSDTTKSYIIRFQNKYKLATGTTASVEYSINSGASWNNLNDPGSDKKSWYNNPGFVGPFSSNWKFSKHRLDFLGWPNNIVFRFIFTSGTGMNEGWLIDDFSISEEQINLKPIPSDTIKDISKYFSSITHTQAYEVQNDVQSFPFVPNDFYLSNDTILDSSDTLLSTNTWTFWASTSNISTVFQSVTLNLPSNLFARDYYIFCKVDTSNMVPESNELDNVSYTVLRIDSTFEPPYVESFENVVVPWKTYESSGNSVFWVEGPGTRHHLEGTHSGSNAWSTSESNSVSFTYYHYLQSPFIDLSSGTNILRFWYKTNSGSGLSLRLEYSLDGGNLWPLLSQIPASRDDDWDYFESTLNCCDTSQYAKFRISYKTHTQGPEGLVFDDFYVGSDLPDITIEKDLANRFTRSDLSTDLLDFNLVNSSHIFIDSIEVNFYWSTDSILDVGDPLVQTFNKYGLTDTTSYWESISYAKPSLTNGTYYLFYYIDEGQNLQESIEINNVGYFTIYQQDITPVPYLNDFDSSVVGWRHNASLGISQWQWSMPDTSLTTEPFDNSPGWITNDTGDVADMCRMHLYTPVFDLTGVSNPVLEFDMFCHIFSGINMTYSVDNGATWNILEPASNSFKHWYTPMGYADYQGLDFDRQWPDYSYLFFDYVESAFVSSYEYYGRDNLRSTKYILDITHLQNYSAIQFRYNLTMAINNSLSVFNSDYAEGVLIDNFTIRDKFVDLDVEYSKTLLTGNGGTRISFFMDVKNNGNYISNPTTVKFYLSVDTILDGSDYFVWQESISPIRPDLSQYINIRQFIGSASFADYNYMIYDVDAVNTNQESNELNNIGYWNLGSDGISNYPYIEDFSSEVVDGWTHYTSGGISTGGHRIRNTLAPNENGIVSRRLNGEMFTDKVDGTSAISQVPYMYLESPSFDFELVDSIGISFDLICSGRTTSGSKDGGNLHYSTNGGNSWTLLNPTQNTYNWYDFPFLNNLNSEPGWSGVPPAIPDSVYVDVSFLSGQPDVKFRFKYRSNWHYFGGGTRQGLRVDSFAVNVWGQSFCQFSQSEFICSNDSILLGGAYQQLPGVYYDTISGGGCDSIIETTLFVTTGDFTSTNTNMCGGDSILLGGAYQTDSGTYLDSLQNVNGCDSIVETTLIVNPGYISSTNENICNGDSILLAGTYQTSSGTYVDSFQTVNGCDSLIETTLAITIIDASLVVSYDTLLAPVSYDSYQWMDCDANSIIIGATDNYFVTDTTGNYAVELTLNNCVGTSICKTITIIGIVENNFNSNLTAYPNPTNDIIVVDFGASYNNVNLLMYNSKGQLVKSHVVLEQKSVEINLSTYATGLYLLNIRSKGRSAIVRILKE